MTLGPSLQAPAAPAGRATPRPRSLAWGGTGVLLGIVAAVLAIALFVLLDYQFRQPEHRIIKVVLGLAFISTILLRPRIGLYLFPVLAPFLPWLPNLPVPGVNTLNLLLFSVFMTWVLYRVLQRQPVFRPARLGWWLAALIGVCALALARGAAFPTTDVYEVPGAALQLFRAAVSLSAYFIALLMVRGEKDRRILVWAILMGLVAEAIATIVFGRSGRGSRAVGSIGQANELGTFLAIYTVFAAAMFTAFRGFLARTALVGAIGIGIFATILSVSRGALVALVIGLLYVGLKSSRLLTMMFLLVLVTSPLWAPDFLKDRLTSTQVEVEGTDETELEGGAQLRVDTWRAIGEIVRDHPLEGVGFAGLAFVLPEQGERMGLEVKDSADNTFLRFLAEMGIFGLVLFCVVLWKCWRLGQDAVRAATNLFDRQLGLGFAAATLVLAVSCAFGDRFFNILITGGFWVLAALANDAWLERKRGVA